MRNIFYILILLFITSCSVREKIVEVPVEKIKKEYIYNTKIDTIRDSIMTKDSVFMYIQGDTVFKTKIQNKYLYKYRNIYIKDTIYNTDTIPKIVTVTKENKATSTIIKDAILQIGILFLVILLIAATLKLKKNG